MDFIATVYQYAFVGLMLDWIKNDMKGEPEVIVDRLAAGDARERDRRRSSGCASTKPHQTARNDKISNSINACDQRPITGRFSAHCAFLAAGDNTQTIKRKQ